MTNGTDGNLVGVAAPGLATTLANNGGPTPTIALLAGSAAIGGGSSTISGVTVPTTDQRGVARPSGSISIGAYQYVAPPVVIAAVKSSAVTATAPAPAAVSSGIVSVSLVKSAKGSRKEVSKKKLPNGGSSVKFHLSKHTATLKKTVSAVAKHAKVSLKKK
jgi:hypothetical protein